MSTIFAASSYGNSTLLFDPNGQLAQELGPHWTRWLMGNSISTLTLGSNLGFPRVSPYFNVASPVRYPPSGPSAITVFPVRFGTRFGFVPNSWNYKTGT